MTKSWKQKLEEYHGGGPIPEEKKPLTADERLRKIRGIVRKMESDLDELGPDESQQDILRRALADIDAFLGRMKNSGRRHEDE